MFPARDSQLRPANMRALVLKVQQHPQFEARVRDSELDSVIPRLLLCIINPWVIIDVKNAPHFVVTQVCVLGGFRRVFGILFLFGRSGNQGLGHASGT
jgi:hypothetical protein